MHWNRKSYLFSKNWVILGTYFWDKLESYYMLFYYGNFSNDQIQDYGGPC